MGEDIKGVLIERIVIEKYATDDDIVIGVETNDGHGNPLALVDVLGMLTFAQHHVWEASVNDDYEDEDE